MSVKKVAPMGFQFYVLDPYIIAMHHRDLFPKGNGKMGPIEMPLGKNNGNDFDMNASWRMYHGNTISGFPVHPHRGFETVTVMVEGFADHFDSKGSKGRYGQGDVQWMTAGAGVQHSEMFPMLKDDTENPMELFQIWLNLPKKNKFANPDYKMFWSEDIPTVTERGVEVKIIAGEYKGVKSLDPLPDSWAYDRNNHVGIWIITLEPKAEMTIPAVSSTLNRVLYNYEGGGVIDIDGNKVEKRYYAELEGDKDIRIVNGEEATKLLLLEGEPINEPLVSYGPFVMNNQAEIKQALLDYQKTQFGGWPWEREDPVNTKEQERFASYNNGERVEYPNKK
ncbi:pirin family protein [Dysgonomonas massiliensis]|uniref:pirin family protein n=1 Tax=Dysgonomonas massiliensis TaxID=2040292 RepID=UPI000C790DD0|nr:pirin family protein [Dysgonomonas massiliensis]